MQGSLVCLLQEAEQVREKDKKKWQDFVNKVRIGTQSVSAASPQSIQCASVCS